MELTNDTWVYSDTKKSVRLYEDRECGKCQKGRTKEDNDPCIGTLKYAMNVCCGHGEIKEAYFQFLNGFCLKGVIAVLFINILKWLRNAKLQ